MPRLHGASGCVDLQNRRPPLIRLVVILFLVEGCRRHPERIGGRFERHPQRRPRRPGKLDQRAPRQLEDGALAHAAEEPVLAAPREILDHEIRPRELGGRGRRSPRRAAVRDAPQRLFVARLASERGQVAVIRGVEKRVLVGEVLERPQRR